VFPSHTHIVRFRAVSLLYESKVPNCQLPKLFVTPKLFVMQVCSVLEMSKRIQTGLNGEQFPAAAPSKLKNSKSGGKMTAVPSSNFLRGRKHRERRSSSSFPD